VSALGILSRWQRRGASSPQLAQPQAETISRPEDPAGQRAWTASPPVRPVSAGVPTVVAPDFSATLATWQDPSFSIPMRHFVRRDAPSGMIGAAPIMRAPASGALALPALQLPVVRPAGPDAEGPAADPAAAHYPAPVWPRTFRRPVPGRFTTARARQPVQRRLASLPAPASRSSASPAPGPAPVPAASASDPADVPVTGPSGQVASQVEPVRAPGDQAGPVQARRPSAGSEAPSRAVQAAPAAADLGAVTTGPGSRAGQRVPVLGGGPATPSPLAPAGASRETASRAAEDRGKPADPATRRPSAAAPGAIRGPAIRAVPPRSAAARGEEQRQATILPVVQRMVTSAVNTGSPSSPASGPATGQLSARGVPAGGGVPSSPPGTAGPDRAGQPPAAAAAATAGGVSPASSPTVQRAPATGNDRTPRRADPPGVAAGSGRPATAPATGAGLPAGPGAPAGTAGATGNLPPAARPSSPGPDGGLPVQPRRTAAPTAGTDVPVAGTSMPVAGTSVPARPASTGTAPAAPRPPVPAAPLLDLTALPAPGPGNGSAAVAGPVRHAAQRAELAERREAASPESVRGGSGTRADAGATPRDPGTGTPVQRAMPVTGGRRASGGTPSSSGQNPTHPATAPLVGQRVMRSPLAALRAAPSADPASTTPAPESGSWRSSAWHGTDPVSPAPAPRSSAHGRARALVGPPAGTANGGVVQLRRLRPAIAGLPGGVVPSPAVPSPAVPSPAVLSPAALTSAAPGTTVLGTDPLGSAALGSTALGSTALGSTGPGDVRSADAPGRDPSSAAPQVVRVRPAQPAVTGFPGRNAPETPKPAAPVQRLMAPARPVTPPPSPVVTTAPQSAPPAVRSAAAPTPLPVLPAGPRPARAAAREGTDASPATRRTGPVTVMRSAAPKTQPVPLPAAATVQRSSGTAGRRPAEPAIGSGAQASSKASSKARPDPSAGVDIDEIVGLVSRRLRSEFRIDRERFGRLRDSPRW